MEKLFEGKRIIDLEVYQDMKPIERREIEKVLIRGKFIRNVEIDGEQYEEIQQLDAQGSMLVSKEMVARTKEITEMKIKEVVESLKTDPRKIPDNAKKFNLYIKTRHITEKQVDGYIEEIKTTLNKTDFENFMYALYLRVKIDREPSKVDFEKYISYGILYQKLTTQLKEVAKKTRK